MKRTTIPVVAVLTMFVTVGGVWAPQPGVPDPVNGTFDQPSAMSGNGFTLVGLCLPAGTAEMTARDFVAADLLSPDGEAACYPDCDQSTGPGVLDVFDFLCFQNAFVTGDPYACECDTSTGPNVCDVFDFLCFQNAFVAGCP